MTSLRLFFFLFDLLLDWDILWDGLRKLEPTSNGENATFFLSFGSLLDLNACHVGGQRVYASPKGPFVSR